MRHWQIWAHILDFDGIWLEAEHGPVDFADISSAASYSDSAGGGFTGTRITFDNTGSDIYTIIEVDTRDRIGLIHDLTNTLYKNNISIFSLFSLIKDSKFLLINPLCEIGDP